MAGRRFVPESVSALLKRVPRWTLITIGIAVLVVAAEVTYLIASSGGGADEPQAERGLPCNKRAATNAVEGEFGRAVRDLGTVPPLSEVLDIYDVRVVGCADLTGDGVEDMVVQLAEPGLDLTGAEGEGIEGEGIEGDTEADAEAGEDPAVPPPAIADPASPWAIYAVRDQEWAPAVIRARAERAVVEIGEGEVTERSPGLAAGELACCPSDERVGAVRWKGEEFSYRPRGGPRGRTLAFADGQAAALAGFDLRSGSLFEAIEHFGPVSTYARAGPLCAALWRDLGLELELSASGGLDPCGPDGTVATVRLEGGEAAQAGWKTEDGARVGAPEEELAELYPDMEEVEEDQQTALADDEEGRLFALVLGEDGAAPVLAARLDGDGVIAFEVAVIPAPDPAATSGDVASGETTTETTTSGESPAP